MYTNGISHDEHTGGLKGYAYKMSTSGATVAEPTLSIDTNGVTFSVSNATASSPAAALFTERPIDLTPYTKMKIKVKAYSAQTDTAIGIGVTKSKANSFVLAATKGITATGEYELDITALSGEHYCVVHLSSGHSKSISFDYWKLER